MDLWWEYFLVQSRSQRMCSQLWLGTCKQYSWTRVEFTHRTVKVDLQVLTPNLFFTRRLATFTIYRLQLINVDSLITHSSYNSYSPIPHSSSLQVLGNYQPKFTSKLLPYNPYSPHIDITPILYPITCALMSGKRRLLAFGVLAKKKDMPTALTDTDR